jgi:hypothetical protein
MLGVTVPLGAVPVLIEGWLGYAGWRRVGSPWSKTLRKEDAQGKREFGGGDYDTSYVY